MKTEKHELFLTDELAAFALEMQYKLDLNNTKECAVMNPQGGERSWKKCKPNWLLWRLRQETLELERAIACGETREIRNEAADVANFAMFIFDIAKSKNRKAPESLR